MLILISKHDSKRNKLLKTLNTSFKNKVEVRLDFLENFTGYISSNKLNGFVSGIPFSNFNLVYFTGKISFSGAPRSISACLRSNNIPFVGHVLHSGDKFTSLCKLAENKIKIADSVLGNNINLIKKLKFPVIAKDLKIHRNRGIYVINTKKDIKNFIDKYNTKEFLFQSFINIRKEYRILVLGGKAVSVHTKVMRNYQEEKINYNDVNEIYEFISLNSISKSIITEAEKSSKALGLDVAGVDICIDKKGKIYVIEVNRSPGIDYSENSPEIKGLVEYFSQALIPKIL